MGSMVPLVGRRQELERLARVIERAAAGESATVLVSGEAGVGKTRLAAEATALARGRGFLVLEGRGYALEATLAHAPIREAIGRHLRTLEPRGRRRLLGEAPELARFFDAAPEERPAGGIEAALEKTKLFDEVAALLGRLATEQPVALLVDDLHWADAASLELVHFCVRSLAGRRFLFLATFRDDGGPALAPLVRSLRRLGPCHEVTVPRLHGAEAEALIESLLGGKPPQELGALVQKRAGGVPLFVETLIRSLVESDKLRKAHNGFVLDPGAEAVLPALVRDLILERLDRLTAEDRRLIDLMAASGESIEHTRLLAASELSEEALLAAVRRLRQAGLLTEEEVRGRAAYACSHPLLLEVAYAELSTIVRQRLHLAIALTYEAIPAGDGPGRLARHYRGAGSQADPDRSLDVQLAAGAQAMSVFAAQEAVAHLAGALALVRQGTRPAVLAEVLERLGAAWLQVGEPVAAISGWTEALAEREKGSASAETVARLRRLIAAAEWERGRLAEAKGQLEAAVQALAGEPASPELARILQAQVTLAERAGELLERGALVARLESVAAAAGQPALEFEAMLAAARLRIARHDYRSARELAARARARADAEADPRLMLRARDFALGLAVEEGDPRAIRGGIDEAFALSRRCGAPAEEMRLHGYLAAAAYIGGAWDETEREIESAFGLARRYEILRGVARLQGLRAALSVVRGDLPAAEASLREARTIALAVQVDRRVVTFLAWVEGLLAVELEDAARGRALADLAAPDGEIYARRLLLLGDLALLEGSPDEALRVTEELRRSDDLPGVQPLALALAGRARARARAPAAARRDLRRAAEALDAQGMPFDAAQARLDEAAVSDGDHAIRLAEASLAAFERLGALRRADRARQFLRAAGVKPPPRRRPGPGGGPLSKRELEVARLYADGLTTAEVAKRLIISPHTAATHLQRIYERLGVSSRAALTKRLVERSLL